MIKQHTGVWGTPIYEGNVIMIIVNGELRPRILYKISPQTFHLLKFQHKVVGYKVEEKEFNNYSEAEKHAFSIVGYIPPKASSYFGLKYNSPEYLLHQKARDLVKAVMIEILKPQLLKIKKEQQQTNIVAVENPLFKINIAGFSELFDSVSKAKTLKALPENYKIGDRISHGKKKSITIIEKERDV